MRVPVKRWGPGVRGEVATVAGGCPTPTASERASPTSREDGHVLGEVDEQTPCRGQLLPWGG
eukprot:1949385-Pyramimonas_sp.AAC.1